MQHEQKQLLESLRALVVDEIHPTGNIGNLLGELKQRLSLFWIGLYLEREGRLVLGPFQGMAACTIIHIGKGVCGTAAATGQVQVVDDVRLIDNYIACHEEARSEIVLPGYDSKGRLGFVLDVDSEEVAAFSQEDIPFWQEVVRLLEPFVEKL